MMAVKLENIHLRGSQVDFVFGKFRENPANTQLGDSIRSVTRHDDHKKQYMNELRSENVAEIEKFKKYLNKCYDTNMLALIVNKYQTQLNDTLNAEYKTFLFQTLEKWNAHSNIINEQFCKLLLSPASSLELALSQDAKITAGYLTLRALLIAPKNDKILCHLAPTLSSVVAAADVNQQQEDELIQCRNQLSLNIDALSVWPWQNKTQVFMRDFRKHMQSVKSSEFADGEFDSLNIKNLLIVINARPSWRKAFDAEMNRSVWFGLGPKIFKRFTDNAFFKPFLDNTAETINAFIKNLKPKTVPVVDNVGVSSNLGDVVNVTSISNSVNADNSAVSNETNKQAFMQFVLAVVNQIIRNNPLKVLVPFQRKMLSVDGNSSANLSDSSSSSNNTRTLESSLLIADAPVATPTPLAVAYVPARLNFSQNSLSIVNSSKLILTAIYDEINKQVFSRIWLGVGQTIIDRLMRNDLKRVESSVTVVAAEQEQQQQSDNAVLTESKQSSSPEISNNVPEHLMEVEEAKQQQGESILSSTGFVSNSNTSNDLILRVLGSSEVILRNNNLQVEAFWNIPVAIPTPTPTPSTSPTRVNAVNVTPLSQKRSRNVENEAVPGIFPIITDATPVSSNTSHLVSSARTSRSLFDNTHQSDSIFGGDANDIQSIRSDFLLNDNEADEYSSISSPNRGRAVIVGHDDADDIESIHSGSLNANGDDFYDDADEVKSLDSYSPGGQYGSTFVSALTVENLKARQAQVTGLESKNNENLNINLINN